MSGSLVKREAAPPRWWVALLLSLAKPGLGQLYTGQPWKACCLFAGDLLALSLLVSAVWLPRMDLMVAGAFLVLVGCGGFSILDAVRTARNKGQGCRRRWWHQAWLCGVLWVCFLAGFSVVAHLLTQSVVQPFRIPSPSNAPTILPGDWILVDRRIPARLPLRGTFIVFSQPSSPRLVYLKRVVALGGDVVALRDKQLLVNQHPVREPSVRHTDAIILPMERSARDNVGPLVVPDGSCYVLGDNRDTSYDSRFFGPVAEEQILGRMRMIVWSMDVHTHQVRWQRIGRML